MRWKLLHWVQGRAGRLLLSLPALPKNPSLCRVSEVRAITASFHRQIVSSFTLASLNSVLQDFFRVFTQS